MFSLIITIISIALVAALALATLYYGGGAFNKGAAEAKAAKILLQGQQLLGASELYKADTGQWPLTMNALVTSKYLKSLPVAQGVVGEAFADDKEWRMPSAGTPVFVLTDVNVATCQSLNKKAYGVDAVLKTARTEYLNQCFGTSTLALKVVVGKTSGDLLDAAADPAASALMGTVVGLPAPSSPLSPEWLDLTGAGNTVTPDPVVPVDPGPAPLPLASLSTLYLDFGSVATNTTEKRQVMLSNPGTGVLVLTAPSLSATSHEAFTPLTTECGTSLAVNESCLTEVSFSPTAVGEAAGTLSFATNAAVGPVDVEVHATAYNPVTLEAGTVPSGKLGQAYTPFSFSSLLNVSNDASPTLGDVSWGKTGELPTGLTLSATGVLSGTPTATTVGPGTAFTVLATYKLNQGQQAYTIKVGEVVLEVTSISGGGSHTCAVTTTGGVKCWGQDNVGQLGNDAALDNQATPVDVLGLTSGVASVSAGYYHTCAVTIAGAALCWGHDGSGQLGNDAPLSGQSTPVAVLGLSSGVASVSAGVNHTCAVTMAGAALCWGNDGYGQLGNDTSLTNSPFPLGVSGLSSGVASVSAGGSHTCAVTTAGAAWCWGRNSQSQLGNASLSDSSVPVAVSGLSSGVANVSAGSIHTCAVTRAGAALCWGYDGSGQLGNDTSLTNRSTPVAVYGLSSGVASISASSGQSCAVTTAGAAMCWGADNQGQLGNDVGLAGQPLPVPVLGLSSGVSSISAGGNHTCAVTAGGAAKCWGRNYESQLGNDSGLTDRPTPVNVAP